MNEYNENGQLRSLMAMINEIIDSIPYEIHISLNEARLGDLFPSYEIYWFGEIQFCNRMYIRFHTDHMEYQTYNNCVTLSYFKPYEEHRMTILNLVEGIKNACSLP